jgi:ParB family chromosome partitioning protein
MTRPAFVQTEFDFAIREINALEIRIVTAEDDADAMLWEQARQVVAQLDAAPRQGRQLARQWINTRTGEPYSERHVRIVKQVFNAYFNTHPRPRFREAYNEIANASPAHVSHNSGNIEWYTPREYIEAARAVLGAIDLDPASCPEANAIVGALTFYTLEQDGLAQSWRGRVWMNPPYAHPAIEHFAAKFAESVRAREMTAGIALVNNGTETEWFRRLSEVATAVCFPTGRIGFWSTNPEREIATPLQGQAVLYAGDQVEAFRNAFGPFGVVLVKP